MSVRSVWREREGRNVSAKRDSLTGWRQFFEWHLKLFSRRKCHRRQTTRCRFSTHWRKIKFEIFSFYLWFNTLAGGIVPAIGSFVLGKGDLKEGLIWSGANWLRRGLQIRVRRRHPAQLLRGPNSWLDIADTAFSSIVTLCGSDCLSQTWIKQLRKGLLFKTTFLSSVKSTVKYTLLTHTVDNSLIGSFLHVWTYWKYVYL